MLKVIQWIRPSGEARPMLFATDHEEFFRENNIAVEFEYDNMGMMFFYVCLKDYVLEGKDPEELIKILPESRSMSDAFAECRKLAEDYMERHPLTEYLQQDVVG